MPLSELLSITLLLALASIATWRVTHMLNLEDGPWDVFLRLREHVGLRVFNDLSSEDQLAWLDNNKLAPDGMPPHYAHDGNVAAKWLECHGCISVTVGFITLALMWLVALMTAPFVILGTPIVSFGSIIIELKIKSR